MDPLDSGEPGLKAWNEFRGGFASAFFLAWLASDFDQLAPYFAELQEAITSADLYEPLLKEDAEREGREWDGEVPILRDSVTDYVPLEDALLFQEMLFTEGSTADDHEWAMHGLATIALHSSLEAYCATLGIPLKRTSLPSAVIRHLESSPARPVLLAAHLDGLRDCDATRHLLIHHRGVVNEQYIRSVAGTTLVPGERRPLGRREVFGFSRAVWATASALRAAVA